MLQAEAMLLPLTGVATPMLFLRAMRPPIILMLGGKTLPVLVIVRHGIITTTAREVLGTITMATPVLVLFGLTPPTIRVLAQHGLTPA